MREENGGTSKNARIKIDYSSKIPKVKFSYPSKKYQQSGTMFPIILIILFLLIFPCCYFILESQDVELKNNQIILQIDNLNKIYDTSDYNNFSSIFANETIINETFYELNKEDKILEIIFSKRNKIVYSSVFLPVILAFLIYYPFRKRWNSIYPKFQGRLCPKRLTVLSSKDIKKEGDRYYCEIPIFKNIILDYKATGDFSKHLKLFEIKEHKFKFYYKVKLKNLKKRKMKEVNDCYWYAKFYFDTEPKRGYIKVIFK